MGGFVFFVLLDGSEVPTDCLLIVSEDFVVHADVVVARCVLRCNLTGFLVPGNCLLVFFLSAAVNDSDLVEGSSVAWMQLCNLLEFGDSVVSGGFVSCQYKQTHTVVGLDCYDLICDFLGFVFQNALVLVDVSDALERSCPVGFEIADSVVVVKSLFKNSFVIEDVSVAENKCIVFGIIIYHLSIPLHGLFHLFVVFLESHATEG
jgi:hypothetical protein